MVAWASCVLHTARLAAVAVAVAAAATFLLQSGRVDAPEPTHVRRYVHTRARSARMGHIATKSTTCKVSSPWATCFTAPWPHLIFCVSTAFSVVRGEAGT